MRFNFDNEKSVILYNGINEVSRSDYNLLKGHPLYDKTLKPYGFSVLSEKIKIEETKKVKTNVEKNAGDNKDDAKDEKQDVTGGIDLSDLNLDELPKDKVYAIARDLGISTKNTSFEKIKEKIKSSS